VEDGTAILLNTIVENVIDVFVVRRQPEVGLTELTERVVRSRGRAHTSRDLVRDVLEEFVLEIHGDPNMPFMVVDNKFILTVQDNAGFDGRQLTALRSCLWVGS
jgi:hypothetical protein